MESNSQQPSSEVSPVDGRQNIKQSIQVMRKLAKVPLEIKDLDSTDGLHGLPHHFSNSGYIVCLIKKT